VEDLFARSSPSDASSSYVFADYASFVGSLVDQADFVVVEVEDSVAVAVEVAVVPVPVVLVLVLAAAVNGEDMVLAAALKMVVQQVIVVLVFVPEERHHSVVAFRALPREMYCSVYSAVGEAVAAGVHLSALVGLVLA